MSDEDLAYAEIADLAPRVKSGEISPVEVTHACLERIAALDGRINSFITLLSDSALEEAHRAEKEIRDGHYRGPLHGIPMAHKDLYYTRGFRTTAGSKVLSDFIPDDDATVVARLRDAGCVLLGKLNMHEFAAGGTNENDHYGNVHNPWALERIPGGSSGGSSAALAAGFCLAATGSDTAGSIRIPSDYCGTTGIKPTFGRVSRYGVVPLSWSLDHAGPMTRSARDCALLLQVMAGFDPRDSSSEDVPVPDYSAELAAGVRGLRLGVPRTYFTEALAPDVERAWRDSIQTLVELGANPVEVDFEAVRDSIAIGQIIVRNEMGTFHSDWFPSRAADYGPAVRERLASVQGAPAIDYIRAQRARDPIRAEFRAAFKRADVLVVPTMPTTAPLIGSDPAAVDVRFTYPFNLAGLPSLAIPAGFDGAGLPTGIQIAAPHWQEALCFRVGFALQRVTNWHTQRPPLGAAQLENQSMIAE